MDRTLSVKERLFLVNQYEILTKLSTSDYEKKHYENMADVFRQGYTWGYGLASEGITEEVTEEECMFVLDILNMYSLLYFSRENNDEVSNNIEEKKVLFKGFDLNDEQECKYYSFYRFLVKDLGRYNEFEEWIEDGKIDDFNSHGFGPSMDKLERMVQKKKELDEIRHERNDMYFNAEEIEQILNA